MAPERVERLALLDTGIHPRAANEEAKRQELIDLARSQGMAALAARWLPPMLHPGSLALLEPSDGDGDALDARDFRESAEGAARPARCARQCFPCIQCPTLVLCGRQDIWSPVPQHEEIAACDSAVEAGRSWRIAATCRRWSSRSGDRTPCSMMVVRPPARSSTSGIAFPARSAGSDDPAPASCAPALAACARHRATLPPRFPAASPRSRDANRSTSPEFRPARSNRNARRLMSLYPRIAPSICLRDFAKAGGSRTTASKLRRADA